MFHQVIYTNKQLDRERQLTAQLRVAYSPMLELKKGWYWKYEEFIKKYIHNRGKNQVLGQRW